MRSTDTDQRAPRDGIEDDWPWDDSLDAVEAAPDSHRVLLENDEVRVLRVIVPPGAIEPPHTHRWPSVMIADRPARIRYRNEHGEVAFESPPDIDHGARPPSWMGPEGLHSVENIDETPYLAFRIELKRGSAGSETSARSTAGPSPR